MLNVFVLLETSQVGGPARNLLNTLQLLAGQAHFTLVTYLRKDQVASPFMLCAAERGLDVRVLHERFRYDARAVLQLRVLIQSIQPDLLQIHNTKSRLFGWALRQTRCIPDIPQIDFFHGETWVNAKQRVYNHMDRRLFKRSRHIVVVSEYQTRLLTSWGIPRQRITVIPNAIPLKPAPAKEISDTKTILSVGRLSREKGHITLVRAVGDLVQAGQRQFRLVLVGDGPERNAIDRYIRQNRLQQWITMEGYQPNPEPYYQQADLFVLPSHTEGFPNVLLEAALHHVPMVATAVGGVPDAFVDGQEIALVPDDSPRDLANRLRDFLDSPHKYTQLADRARKRVEEDYNMEKKAQRLLAYYQSVIGSKSVAR